MRKTAQGFTLVELLVVIAIIAILTLVIGVVINPIELRRQSNDAVRLSDMATLQQAINVAAQEATTSGTAVLCVPPVTAPCTGDSNPGTAANRKTDGTGWVKVNLSAQKSVSLPTLPIDPVNDATYHYNYATNSQGTAWEINAVLESQKYATKMAEDGGTNDNVYEKGSDLTIIP